MNVVWFWFIVLENNIDKSDRPKLLDVTRPFNLRDKGDSLEDQEGNVDSP
jgi:hypothetical protein